MSQWVGDAPGVTTSTPGLGRNSSSSTTSSAAAAAAAPSATNRGVAGRTEPTATAAPETRAPLGATPEEGVGDSSSLSLSAEAEAAATTTGETAAGVPGVAEAETVAEVKAADGEVNADAKENALGKKTGGTDGVHHAPPATEGRTVEIVEDAALGDDTSERRDATGVDVTAPTEKQTAGTTFEKTPSMLEMLKMKRGMGIFGKSSSVVPSPIVTAASAGAPGVADDSTVALLPLAGATEAGPEPSTQELRVETTDEDTAAAAAADAAVAAPAGPEGAEGVPDVNGGKAAAGKDKTAATAATPSMLNGLPSRFKMSMGMFGSGKSSPSGASKGSTSAPTPALPAAAATSAPTTVAAAASTPSAAAGASSTPTASSGGAGKFSSYARRAGNFLGENWRRTPLYVRACLLVICWATAMYVPCGNDFCVVARDFWRPFRTHQQTPSRWCHDQR